ncbi:YceD family protein [Nitrosomonas sp.]|uniref:YceD family protein n=1 Tax=Nitrosomonas sp. TaxID=42353 RepID=UPI0025CEA14C|nr:YceD family protein [Nitrosomonas sp.]MCC6917190.1 DUF177 domain-containing protein [Nitrosomonas sp.]
MSDQLVIDTLDFVYSSKTLQGNVPLSNLERLKDYLASSTGKLTYLVTGLLDEQERPMLEISVNGAIDLSCQRCLGKIEHTLDVKAVLLLARNEDELQRYDEDIFADAIYASTELDILALIEDEVILSLPVSPRHENIECHISARAKKCETSVSVKEHPFTVLASLKRPH